MSAAQDVDEAARAADPNVTGTAILSEGAVFEPQWFVVERADDLNVRIDTADGNAPIQAALDAVMNLDLSAGAVAARQVERERTQTVEAFLNDQSPTARVQRATITVLVAELNALRKWIRDFKVEVAASTSLADFKTRVAALNNMADRTLAQAKTAITDAIQVE